MESARHATDDDLDRLVQLAGLARAELLDERGGVTWAQREAPPEPRRAELGVAIADPDASVQVGLLDGYVSGYAVARVETLRSGEQLAVVGDLYVEPPFREVGIGEVMMDAIITWAIERGCAGIDSLVLPGMRESKNFFERYGMKARALLVHLDLSGPSSAAAADEAAGWFEP